MIMRERKKIVLNFDVLIIGGGLSGVCAALASARSGAKTAIVQNRSVFGGCSSSEIRMHICGANCHARKKDLAETGIIEELLLANKDINHNFSFSLWDVVIWSKIKEEKLLECFLNTNMDEVITNKNKIESVICRQMTTEIIYEFSANVYIDATGNASLGYYCGAEYRIGEEGRDEFGEPDAPETPSPYTMGNSLMFTSSDLGEPVQFKKPEWAFLFNEKDLEGRPHGNITVERGENGIVEEYGVDSGYWWIELGGDSKNIIDETETINEELYKCLFGIWDHIKNSGDHGASTYELNWIGSVAGMRESRRLVGDYILSENDILSSRIFNDAVAYGGWPMDMHAPRGLFEPSFPTKHINSPGSYTIPYRCYYSKNIQNLMMAGRDISATHLAFGSTRVMGTCSIGGQAVGTAAAMASKYGCSPKEIGIHHIKELQQTLLRDDCYIPGFRNEDSHDLAVTSTIVATSHIKGYEPINVISGVARVEGVSSNCWESDGISQNGESITLSLMKLGFVNQIRVTFDPNLNTEIMVTMTKRVQKKQVKHLPHELVRNYSVRILNKDNVVFERKYSNNTRRLSITDLPDGIMGDSIELNFLSTYGYKNVRVFEIRIY